MAGAVLGAQNSLPNYFKQGGGAARPNPTVTTFEKELSQVLSSLKKAEKKWPSWEFYQKVYACACNHIVGENDLDNATYNFV